MLRTHIPQRSADKFPRLSCAILQSRNLYVFQYRQPSCCGDRISTECVEVFHSVRKPIRDISRSYHCRQRHAVAERFPHGHDVWHYALLFETPEARPEAPEARLDLVGDTDSALGADEFVAVLQISLRRKDHSSNGHPGFDEEGRYPSMSPFTVLAGLADVVSILLRSVWTSVRAPVRIGTGHHMHPIWLALASFSVELVRRYLDDVPCVPVVCPLHTHYVPATAVRIGQPQREVVCLAS
mmetsp:Transcript_18407/g.45188  ORF Transcript_18407/g.45188 Transcript_18407/m.45188 type:complete len:240 (-) Transcript_18407:493-1212(-)